MRWQPLSSLSGIPCHESSAFCMRARAQTKRCSPAHRMAPPRRHRAAPRRERIRLVLVAVVVETFPVATLTPAPIHRPAEAAPPETELALVLVLVRARVLVLVLVTRTTTVATAATVALHPATMSFFCSTGWCDSATSTTDTTPRLRHRSARRLCSFHRSFRVSFWIGWLHRVLGLFKS